MKPGSHLRNGNRPWAVGNPRAFTMVEIALALAVIGFALVAIIGVLPTGLQVQRENREETIINQDAQVWLNAIRSGARGFDDLTNYVDAITNIVTRFNPDGTVAGVDVYGFTRFESVLNGTELNRPLINGYRIIGLLSRPKYTYHDPANQILATSNHVAAYVRAMSGAAFEKFPQTNTSVRDLAFGYRMVVDVQPYAGWDTNWVQFNVPGLPADEVFARSNYWKVARQLHANTYEIRLLFRWPLLPRGQIGNGRLVYRTTVSGRLENESGWYFFNPRFYAAQP